jgi:hypothetical protein
MSTELKGVESLNGEVLLTRYFGGAENGACVQVTPPGGTRTPYLSLTKEQTGYVPPANDGWENGSGPG